MSEAQADEPKLPAEIDKSPKVAFEKLFSLGTLKMAAIDGHMLGGLSGVKTATMIQEEWGDLKSMAIPSLARQLNRYRETLLEPKLGLAMNQAERRADFFKNVRRYSEQVNVADELADLVAIQKARIKKGVDVEADMVGITNNLRHEFDSLKNILKELGNFQVLTGIVQRAPLRIAGHFTSEVTKAELAFKTSAEDAEKLRVATHGLIQYLENEAPVDSEGYAVDAEFTEVKDAE